MSEVAANKIDAYLHSALSKSSSDLHFISGDPPRVRIHGELTLLNEEKLKIDEVKEALYEIMNGTIQRDFESNDAVDFAYDIPDVSRFRVNVMRHLNGIGAVFRAIPSKAMTLDELNMPAVVHDLCKQTQGMILVTGKTGSGKSTTLAAMIDAINKRMKGHILTIEDPIEFVHKRQGCLISQREIGVHSESFAAALHSALREDPDVILVGEMRDRETIELGITAAETGHLVFGTLHTNSAPKTVDRIIDVFPADEQEQVRSMLAESLKGVVAQVLLRAKDGKSRMVAWELMVGTSAISNLIREGKIHQIPSIIQTGKKDGMQLLDQHILEFLMSDKITPEEAYMKANNKKAFAAHLDGVPEVDFE